MRRRGFACNFYGGGCELIGSGRKLIADEAKLKALMLAGLAGDAAAYRMLLSALGGHLRAYYRRRVGEDAEDLVQETLIAMHARRGT